LTSEQKYTRRRIIEISYEAQFSHLGSCLSAVDIIDAIYKIKKRNERFVLSAGHSGIALYVILEKYGLMDRSDIKKLHIHPEMNLEFGIDVSTGSLGQGLPIALGMALADRDKNVYCVLSDGECAEGSVWEALRVGLEQQALNLKIVINANGWGAYTPISLPFLIKRVRGFNYKVLTVNGHNPDALSKALKTKITGQPLLIFAKTKVEQFPFLNGQDAHYYILDKRDYDLAINILK
jgi:transketolase